MRQVVASLFVSLDGVVEAPEKWHFPYFNDEMGAVIGESMAASDGFLLGRRTYEEWAAFWPAQDPQKNSMAPAMNAKRKFVASRSLGDATWENSTILRGELAEEVTKLKDQEGKQISISGSGTLVRSLLNEGLLDELRLMVHPVLLGRGGRLFEESEAHVPLELTHSQSFSTGVLNLTYRPASA